jgi:hypothetical protein
MQSEYIAASDSTREAVWLRCLLGDLGSTQMGPTALRCDNESAIGLAYNPLAHKGSKHIEGTQAVKSLLVFLMRGCVEINYKHQPDAPD